MPTFYCNYYFLLGTRGPLHSGAPWTLPTLPTPLLRHWPQIRLNWYYIHNRYLLLLSPKDDTHCPCYAIAMARVMSPHVVRLSVHMSVCLSCVTDSYGVQVAYYIARQRYKLTDCREIVFYHRVRNSFFTVVLAFHFIAHVRAPKRSRRTEPWTVLGQLSCSAVYTCSI